MQNQLTANVRAILALEGYLGFRSARRTHLDEYEANCPRCGHTDALKIRFDPSQEFPIVLSCRAGCGLEELLELEVFTPEDRRKALEDPRWRWRPEDRVYGRLVRLGLAPAWDEESEKVVAFCPTCGHRSLVLEGEGAEWGRAFLSCRCQGCRCRTDRILAELSLGWADLVPEEPADFDSLRRALGEAATSNLQSVGGSIAGGVGGPIPAPTLLAGGRGEALEPLPSLLLPGLFIRAWSHLLAGAPKSGKSTLLAALVQEWCQAGLKVLWLSEESQAIWQARLRTWPAVPENLLLWCCRGVPFEQQLEVIQATPSDVLVYDTLRTLANVDELDNQAIAAAMNRLEGAAGTDRTRIYAHHSRKGGGEHGEAVAGGFAFAASVDRVLELEYHPRRKATRVVKVLSRIAEAGPLMYEKAADGQLVLLGSPDAVEAEELGRRVLAVLEEADWLATGEVLERLAEPRPTREALRQVLISLAKASQILRDPPLGEEAAGRTVRWRLPPTQPAILGVGRLQVGGPPAEGASNLPAIDTPIHCRLGFDRPVNGSSQPEASGWGEEVWDENPF